MVTDKEAYAYLEKRQELGIRNVHVHKGPTIWPLDKEGYSKACVKNMSARMVRNAWV